MSTIENSHNIVGYIKDNPVMILGTVDKSGVPHGAAVYVVPITAEQVYFITKKDTQKFKNILDNSQVSLTSADPAENSSLQAMGTAKVLNDARTAAVILDKLTLLYSAGADWLPPVTKLSAGPYELVGVKLQHARLARFKGAKPASEHIFKGF